MISWLFEISTYKYSTKAVTFGGDNYVARIIPDSFDGIIERWDISGSNLISPGEIAFEIDNADDTLSAATFQDEEVTIRLIVNSVETRTWKYVITHEPIEYYGKIKCYAEDFLQAYLDGDYPNTPDPKEVWPSDDESSGDDYCVPIVLGVAYIPVRSVNTGSERYYVLGKAGPTYTVHEVSSPISSAMWSAGSYTMAGSVSSGYQLLQPIIADSTGDGNADAPGLWKNGKQFLDMPCRFSRSDTNTKTSPEEWVRYLLEDFGIGSERIDNTTFQAARVQYQNQGIGFDGGGWWKKESREKVVSNLLSHTDSFLVRTDKVELYQFKKNPIEEITKVLSLSFAPAKPTKIQSDSGRVHWPAAYEKIQSELTGKAVVSTYEGGSTDSPSSSVLEARFFPGRSISAQKAGILHFQKKLDQKVKVSFSLSFLDIDTKATIHPGHVIRINNPIYGESRDIIITEMRINRDLRVDFTGVELYHMNDWDDLTTTTKDVVTDTSPGWQIPQTDYNGDLSMDTEWTNILHIPDRFLDTATLGINVTDDYIGYFDGSTFTNYFDSQGNVRHGDPDNTQGAVWNQSTGEYTVVGKITVKNPIGVRADLNVANGADKTATIISGGLVSTGYIRSSNWGANSGIEFNLTSATLTVREATGLLVSSSGGVKIEDGGDLQFFQVGIQTGKVSTLSEYVDDGIALIGVNGGAAMLESFISGDDYSMVYAKDGIYLASHQGPLEFYFPEYPYVYTNASIIPLPFNVNLGEPGSWWEYLYVSNIAFKWGDTLSTFESGAWTPSITFGGSSTGFSYSMRSGSWLQVNEWVFIQGMMQVSSKGSGTGVARIEQLPKPVSSGNDDLSAIYAVFRNVSRTDGQHFQVFPIPGTTALQLEVCGSGGAYASMQDTAFSNNSQIFLFGAYRR